MAECEVTTTTALLTNKAYGYPTRVLAFPENARYRANPGLGVDKWGGWRTQARPAELARECAPACAGLGIRRGATEALVTAASRTAGP